MVELIPKKGERCFPHLELTRWGDEPNGAKEENRNGHNRFVLKTTEASAFKHHIIIPTHMTKSRSI